MQQRSVNNAYLQQCNVYDVFKYACIKCNNAMFRMPVYNIATFYNNVFTFYNNVFYNVRV